MKTQNQAYISLQFGLFVKGQVKPCFNENPGFA